jgi:REP element-mobilizing transposase RayT
VARPLRIEYDGAVYHVTSRGNARKPIFKDDGDRSLFLDILQSVNRRYNWLCHAYCLMNNHYHVVIETPDGNLSKGMRQLNGVYTQDFNRRHHHVGHVFQGRYKAILIQKDRHLLEVSRYVVLNPIRAWLIEEPDAWAWSSYQATAGMKKAHPCLTTEWVLCQFGESKKTAEDQYRQFVKAGMAEKGVWEKVRGQSILGDERFVENLVDRVRGAREIEEIPRMQRYAARPLLATVLKGASMSDKRILARKVKEAVEGHGYSQREVAEHLGIHYSTVSRILKRQG